MITAVPLRDTNKIMLQCNFAIGSDARGCMVVIVSEFGNTTKNLTRSNISKHITQTFNNSQALNCFTALFGYDIESDGSIGTLAVPGEIMRNFSTIAAPCTPGGLKTSPSELILFHLSFW